ncbi:MAG: gamma-glutamylcyclotransferase [Proteobacteria bacterium]|nr:gamma-glutamylcyclotransferase [Pseudomonadota bacterium]MBU1060206.1 gamma-glutamylcyclotransferase [Pseudomonadota bacterium]
MKYFAYGSNMSQDRLKARVSSVRPIGVYMLNGHELKFHKIGRDGSAKCDASFTGSDKDVIEGVVFEIDPGEVAGLDLTEGVGKGYEKKLVIVTNTQGDTIEAFSYVATTIDDSLQPFTWYKTHVLIGARNAGLSAQYIFRIESLKAIKDLNQERERSELIIYEQ